MNDRFVFWLVVPMAIVAVLWVGWKQPLRYRFMTKHEIAAAERGASPRPWFAKATPEPTPAPATPKSTPWMFDPKRGNTLERAPYR